MSTRNNASIPEPADEQYEQLQARWPAERPSRKRRRRSRRRGGQVRVRSDRLDEIDKVRLSRALLSAQRELLQATAEAEASRQHSSRGPAEQQGEEGR